MRIDLVKVQGRITQRGTERGRGDGISKQRSRIDAVWEKILGCPQPNVGGVDTVKLRGLTQSALERGRGTNCRRGFRLGQLE